MADTALNYFDTGIPELNELLTRNILNGIALPEAKRAASSTFVIKGSTGSGKSVLASIIAYNLHYQLSEASSTFSPSDITNVDAFVEKLKLPSYAVSRYLMADAEIKLSVEKYEPTHSPKLRTILIRHLNRIISGRNIGTLKQFKDVSLRPDTEALSKQNCRGQDVMRLNRMILEDAYPEALSKNQREWCLPFAFYFSFAQPSQGLRVYIDNIFQPARKTRHYPLITSLQNVQEMPGGGGIELLRRDLLNTILTALAVDPKVLEERMSLEDAFERLNKCFSEISESKIWSVDSGDKESIVKETLSQDEKQRTGLDEKSKVRLYPVIIVDPVNFFFDSRVSRYEVAQLFETFRTLRWPLIMTLEDAGNESSEVHRQLMSHVEFEADVVVTLVAHPQPYARRTIEVTKSRNSQPHFGSQMFRIETPAHSLWNIPSTWGDPPRFKPPAKRFWLKPDSSKGENRSGNHPGFLIFKSIHWHLSGSRHRDLPSCVYHSGMSKLDDILGAAAGDEPSLLPPDAFILVHGKKGGHKLSIAFNILVAGLWNRRAGSDENPKIVKSNSVMLLSMGEETRIQAKNIALAVPNDESSGEDNGKRIVEFTCPDPCNVGDKIMLHEWRWTSPQGMKLEKR